ncbi:hypothetical protein ACMBCN_00790 [Candidatus Liberibacter asiaticus]|nr:hypothetical protein [Candidatus Liberibacter asiaticus]
MLFQVYLFTGGRQILQILLERFVLNLFSEYKMVYFTQSLSFLLPCSSCSFFFFFFLF